MVPGNGKFKSKYASYSYFTLFFSNTYMQFMICHLSKICSGHGHEHDYSMKLSTLGAYSGFACWENESNNSL